MVRRTSQVKLDVPKSTDLESVIQKRILDHLNLKNIQVSVTNADRTWGKGGGVRASKVPKGHPDLTAVLPVKVGEMSLGLAWYIEVKTETGTIKPEQKEKLQALSNAGALCTVARNLEDVSWITRLQGQVWTPELQDGINRILDINLNERRTKKNREAVRNIIICLLARI